MSGERRREPRVDPALRLAAVQQLGNRRLPRVATRLGASGFFLEGAGDARVGDLLVLELGVEGEGEGEGGPLRVTGEVAYATAEGVGVRITRADWRRLTALLARRVHGAAQV